MRNSQDLSQVHLAKIVSYNHAKTNMTMTIIFVLKGSLTVKTDNGDTRLRENDIYFLYPGTAGYLYGDNENLTLLYELDSALLEDFLDDIKNPAVSNVDRDGALRSVLADIARSRFTNNAAAYFLFQSHIYKLVYLLSSDLGGGENIKRDVADNRALKIKQYINKNYRYPISIQDLAKHINLTPQYVSRFIKAQLGMNFTDYIKEIRLKKSVKTLITTEETATAISFANGFPNMTAFNEAFKEKYHTTPLKYRKEKREERNHEIRQGNIQTLDLHIADQYLGKYPPGSIDVTSNDDAKLQVVINVKQHEKIPLNPIWFKIINLGFASDILNYDFEQQLIAIQHDLNFRYARIEGLFDSDIIDRIPNTPHFNFSNANRIFDLLLSIHLIPFIELAPKPIKISVSINKDIELKKRPNIFSVDSEWNIFMQEFISNCINRYGVKEVEQWHFEYWAFHGVHLEYEERKIEKYVERFKDTYCIIKKIIPNAQIGGPGFNVTADTKTLALILQEIQNAGINQDFVSIYLFHHESIVDTLGNHSCFSTRKDFFEFRIENVKKIMRRLGLQCPLYVSQWNFSYIARNYLNDSVFKTAFIVKNLLENNSAVSGIGYWLLSDLTSWYKDISQILFGGYGLVSKDDIHKPAYFAYHFLSMLNGTIIEKGNGYIVTSGGLGIYQILLYHYCHPADFYCLKSDAGISKENINDIFGSAARKNVTVDLVNIPAGNYRIRKMSVNQNHGSVLDQWNKMKGISDLSPQEVRYLKNVSVPKMSIYMGIIVDHIQIQVNLGVNEVCIFSINKQMES
jgi:xylan 1,4-beta-xylosidase